MNNDGPQLEERCHRTLVLHGLLSPNMMQSLVSKWVEENKGQDHPEMKTENRPANSDPSLVTAIKRTSEQFCKMALKKP